MKGPIMKKFFFIAMKSFAGFLLTSILAFSWAQEKFPSRQVTFVIPLKNEIDTLGGLLIKAGVQAN